MKLYNKYIIRLMKDLYNCYYKHFKNVINKDNMGSNGIVINYSNINNSCYREKTTKRIKSFREVYES